MNERRRRIRTQRPASRTSDQVSDHVVVLLHLPAGLLNFQDQYQNKKILNVLAMLEVVNKKQKLLLIELIGRALFEPPVR